MERRKRGSEIGQWPAPPAAQGTDLKKANVIPAHITGLPMAPFAHLTGPSDEALAAHRTRRHVATGVTGRIELREAKASVDLIDCHEAR